MSGSLAGHERSSIVFVRLVEHLVTVFVMHAEVAHHVVQTLVVANHHLRRAFTLILCYAEWSLVRRKLVRGVAS